MTNLKPLLLFLVVGFCLALWLREAPADPQPDPEPMPMAHMGGKEPAEPEKKTGLLIDLGNKNCPVMGNEADGETYVEWNHLRIGVCCPGCDKTVLKDPKKVLDEAGIEWRDAAEAAAAYLDAPEGEREARLADIRKRFLVVRE